MHDKEATWDGDSSRHLKSAPTYMASQNESLSNPTICADFEAERSREVKVASEATIPRPYERELNNYEE